MSVLYEDYQSEIIDYINTYYVISFRMVIRILKDYDKLIKFSYLRFEEPSLVADIIINELKYSDSKQTLKEK
jgi:hypothetical protein